MQAVLIVSKSACIYYFLILKNNQPFFASVLEGCTKKMLISSAAI